MLQDLARAFAQLRDPRVRAVLWQGIGLALLTYVGLLLGAGALLAWLAETGYLWLDRVIEVLGVLGAAVVALLLFPATVIAVSGFLLERVVEIVERRWYPALPPAEGAPLGQELVAAVRLALLSLLLNLLLLPLYLLPGPNLVLWLALNGWLVGREYVELVAARRLGFAATKAFRRRHRLRVWAAGVPIAFLLTVPVLNLVAPIVGAAFMTRRFHRLAPAALGEIGPPPPER